MPTKMKNFKGKTQVNFSIRVTPEVKEQLDIISDEKSQSLNKTTTDLIEQALLHRELCEVLDHEVNNLQQE